MNGQPVWLASVSYWPPPEHDVPVLTGDYNPQQHETAKKLLFDTVYGVGDIQRQRLFRMNLTMCLHRALTQKEVALLPDQCPRPSHLAGGPIEVLWETEPGNQSTQPCTDPIKDPFGTTWIPVDCGRCAPCLSRRALEPA